MGDSGCLSTYASLAPAPVAGIACLSAQHAFSRRPAEPSKGHVVLPSLIKGALSSMEALCP